MRYWNKASLPDRCLLQERTARLNAQGDWCPAERHHRLSCGWLAAARKTNRPRAQQLVTEQLCSEQKHLGSLEGKGTTAAQQKSHLKTEGLSSHERPVKDDLFHFSWAAMLSAVSSVGRKDTERRIYILTHRLKNMSSN